jgi:hypothetical protein
MRQPTPTADQLAWWRDALSGFGKVVGTINKPQCGWFKRRLVHGGPFVPARIWLEQEVDSDTGELIADEVMLCEVDGRRCDPVEQWPRLWTEVITEAEFNYMTATRNWAAWWAPSDPVANPRERIDPLTSPIRF